MYTVLVVLQCIGIVFSLYVLGSLLHEKQETSGRTLMTFIIMLVLIQGSGYLLELLARSQDAALVAVKMEYIGGAYMVIFISRLIYAYCNLKEPKYLFGILELTALSFMVLLWTCERHHLYYKRILFIQQPTPHLELEHGIGYYGFVIICMLFPYLLAGYNMVRLLKKEGVKRRRGHYAMVIGFSLLPITSLFLYLTDITGYYDPLPPIMSVLVPSVMQFIWRRQNFDLAQIASNAVIKEMNDSVVLLDTDKRVIDFNEAARTVFPDLNDEIMGRSIVAVRDFPLEILDNMGESVTFSIGERAFMGNAKKIGDAKNGEIGYVILVYDMTENKQNYEKLMEITQQAEENSAIMTEFLDNMVSEISKPIDTIAGLSDLIIEESRGRKVYQFACDIKDSSYELLDMVDDLSKLSKMEAGKLDLAEKGYNLKTMMTDISDSMNIVAEKKDIRYVLEMNDELPCMLFGDENALRDILISCINNAIRQTKEGYVRIAVNGVRKGERIELEFKVEDTGIGLRQAEVRKLTEYYEGSSKVFDRSVARNQSSLSMSLSKRLLELMGGKVQIESVYGEGTTITISIRQKVMDWLTIGQYDQKTVEETHSEEMRMFSAPDCRILVVDDNLINRKVAIGMLDGYKCQVDEAESGSRAVEMAKETYYDLIFMDQMMPGMDGVEATRCINQNAQGQTRRPKMIALTANIREGAKEMLLSSGFHDYLTKPVERVMMHQCLKKWISEELKIYSGDIIRDASDADVLLDDLDEIFMNGVNIAQAMKKHHGNLNDYLHILLLYYEDGIKRPREFDAHLEASDMENYRILCRALRGASMEIGAQLFAEKLKDLELAASAGDLALIREKHDDILQDFMTIMSEIREVLLRKHLLENDDWDGKEPISDQELRIRLENARQYLEEYEIKACEEMLQELKKYQIKGIVRDYLHDIRVKLRLSEVDAASKLLTDVIKMLLEN